MKVKNHPFGGYFIENDKGEIVSRPFPNHDLASAHLNTLKTVVARAKKKQPAKKKPTKKAKK